MVVVVAAQQGQCQWVGGWGSIGTALHAAVGAAGSAGRTHWSLNLVLCSANQLGAAAPLPVFPAGEPAPLPQQMRCFQPRCCGACTVPGSSTSTVPTTSPDAAGGPVSLRLLLPPPSPLLCRLSRLLSLSLLPRSSLPLELLFSSKYIPAPAQQAAVAACFVKTAHSNFHPICNKAQLSNLPPKRHAENTL